ncbi:MAG: hypothetical protein EAZ29_10680 [Runella slithyformis]|nr:MAG: hypothetical protein EAZ29_10680 [Runella slithyformis]
MSASVGLLGASFFGFWSKRDCAQTETVSSKITHTKPEIRRIIFMLLKLKMLHNDTVFFNPTTIFCHKTRVNK